MGKEVDETSMSLWPKSLRRPPPSTLPVPARPATASNAPLLALPPHSEVASPPSQVFLGGAAAGVATFVFVQPLVLPALLGGAAWWAVSLRRQERKGFYRNNAAIAWSCVEH